MTYKTLSSAVVGLILVFSSIISFAQDQPSTSFTKGNYTLKMVAEIGFLGVFDHKVQFGNTGTYFDYKKDGGQDVLFPIFRPSLELEVNNRNTFIFFDTTFTLRVSGVPQ